ncbi:MAG: carbohydrate binding domain-containing protein, partial [Clostridia bacterium]|nr:carbohydrate binding domain-containing protein [Clostridia bacterium]
NTILKLIASVLTFLTLVTFCEPSLSVFASEIRSGAKEEVWEQNNGDETNDGNIDIFDDEYNDIPYIVGEDESLRTENSKTFRQSDGSFISSVYQESVHFKNAGGEWEDIDNTLVANNSGYTNKSSDFEVVFNSDTEKDDLFTVNYEGSSIAVSYVEKDTVENEQVENEQSEISENTIEETEPETEEIESESEVVTTESIYETESEISDNDTEEDFVETDTETVSFDSDMTDGEDPSIEDAADSFSDEIECSREITVLSGDEVKYTDPALLKTASEVKSELKEQDPDVSDEDIKAAVSRQNEINEEQRTERMTPDELSSSIVYSGIIPGTDLRYDLESKKIKESIVISEPTDNYDYSFFVGTALSAEKTVDGEIVFSDINGDPVFAMPSPYMYDADGNESYEVEYELTESEGGYFLSIDASSEWINDHERCFPVVIDPTVVSAKTSGSDWNIITQYISSLDTSTLHSGEEKWKTGAEQITTTSIAKYYSYLKVQYLPSIPFSCKYVGAYLYLPHHTYTNSGLSSYNLIVKEALSNWRSEFTSNVTNSNPIIDYLTLSSSNSDSYVSMNVTNAVRNWYDGNANNGLVFTSQKLNGSQMTSGTCAYSEFCGYGNAQSGDYSTPFLAVEYRNIVGLEDYYSYETIGVDNAGTAYISDFTGNMTLVKNDVEGNGYTLSHIYNSKYCDRYFSKDTVFNTVDYSNMKIGLGWKLNAQQSVVSKMITGVDSYGHATSIEYLVYSDADGTEHYFQKDTSDPNIFHDEDGLGLTITRAGDTLTMKDEKNNQKIFVYGYLSKIVDRNGNMTVFLYDSTDYSAGQSAWLPKSSTANGKNKLRQIVYVPDGQNAVIVATLYYDSNNRLTSVKDRNSDTVSSFSLGTTGQINYITVPGESTSRTFSYLYGGGNTRMNTIYDGETKFGVDLTYNQTTGAVNQYRDFTATGVNGTRTYYHRFYVNVGSRLTKVRDCGVSMEDSDGDDILTSYVLDNIGRTVTSYTVDGNNNIVGVAGGKYQANTGTSKKNNRLTSAVYSGTVGHNLLWNSGFESGSTSYFSTSVSNNTNFSVSANSSKKHTGSYSLKLYNGAYNGSSMASQSVVLPKTGKYTFSAYIKVDSISVQSGYSDPYGVRIYVEKNGDPIAESEYIKASSGTASDGWIRVSCTFEGTANDSVYPIIVFTGAKGTVYVDDVQFENNGFASEYNLLSETYIRSGTFHSWNNSSYASFVSSTKYNGDNGYVIKVNGAPSKQSYISQDVNVNLSANETYMLSGWAKAASVAPRETSSFQITATLHYTDGTIEYVSAPFSTDVVNIWQYVAKPVVPKKNVSTITVTCSYKANANIAYFDEISLHREIAQAYTYNDDGKLVTVNQTNSDELQNVYQGADLISESGGANGNFTYTYDSNHNVTKAENGDLSLSLTYDDTGNVTTSKLQGTGNKYMQTTATFTDNKTKTASVTDSLGNTTNYSYNVSKNQLTGTTTPVSSSDPYNSGTLITTNTYYDSGRTNLTYISGVVSLSNTYLKGNLSSITRGGYYGSGPKENQTYNFTYDAYGQLTGTSVGNVTLSTNTYDSRERLVGTVYGNGDNVTYSYDNLDRLSGVTHHDSGDTEEYFYDGNSNLSKLVEKQGVNEKRTHYFEYDTLGRLIRQRETSRGDLVGQTEYAYDLKNRLSKYEYYDGKDYVPFEYTYRDSDGALTEYKINTAKEIGLTYDTLNRVSIRDVYLGWGSAELREINSFKAGTGVNQTTNLISSRLYHFVNYGTDFRLYYTYDNVGNIKRIYDNNSQTIGKYLYDDLNQLVYEEVYENGTRVDTREYVYDTYGNIRAVKHYSDGGFSSLHELHSIGTLTSTETYGYPSTDSSFRDKLTSYNNHTITYDGIGNPLSYYNGSSYTMTWQEGRELASVIKGGVTTSYEYNSDGIRTEKTSGGVHTVYRLAGDKIVEMKRTANGSTERYSFTYDENGRPYSVTVPGLDPGTTATYYYVYNIQGDVIKLIDNYGTLAVNYTYDAWGKIVSIKDHNGNAITSMTHVGRVNPFRYRGYVYDEETGFYYCKSRYYDPAIRRWVNADNADVISSKLENFVQFNLYAYCFNNPISFFDNTGSWPEWATILVGVVVAAVAVAATVVTWGAAAPGAVCALTTVGMSIGASYTAATTVATVAVAATATAATMYAGDIAYASVTGKSVLKDTLFQGNEDAYNVGLALTSLANEGIMEITSQFPDSCFVAGTLISTKTGKVSIEEIKTGDQVWAWDEISETVSLKEVKQVFINETTELVHLYVNGEEIVSTPTHPFYSPHKGWTDAVHLRAGDILVLLNGEYVVLEKTQHEILESPIEVYNLEVEDYHTYFVSNCCLLVHNKCKEGKRFDDNQKAVVDLAKENKHNILDESSANILVDFAKEYNINAHYPATHPGRSGIWSNIKHIKIHNIHIAVK